MAKVVYLRDIRKALGARKCKSQWERGCVELAEMIIDRSAELGCQPVDGYDRPAVRYLLEHDLLNGARDWDQYAEAGCLLIGDEEIAAVLCPPSEISRRRGADGALRGPNGRETWMDVQGRAARQAWGYIRQAAMNLTDPDFTFYAPGTAFLSAKQAAAVHLAGRVGCSVPEAVRAVDFDGLEFYLECDGRRIVAGR